MRGSCEEKHGALPRIRGKHLVLWEEVRASVGGVCITTWAQGGRSWYTWGALLGNPNLHPMPLRVAINGFGRIGRSFFRAAFPREDIEIVALNDLGDVANLAYLLKYDTAYGKAPFTEITVEEQHGQKYLNVDGYWVHVYAERDPAQLPWGAHNIDVVVEATGFFAGYAKSKPHLEAGAKRVVISAPVKDDPAKAGVAGATVLMGVNDAALATCHRR